MFIKNVYNFFQKKIEEKKSDTAKLILERINVLKNNSSPVMCNFGCGSRHHPEWINIDFHGNGDSVFPWNLQVGLPLPSASCDVVYSSHLIEHFTRDDARRFLVECKRILKPNGVIRVVAPDLEGLVREYLNCLDKVRQNDAAASDRYEWIIIEMLDQLVRHSPGGEMLKYWAQDNIPAEDFISSRVGVEYSRARKFWRGRAVPSPMLSPLRIGKFRLGGEVHQWMYDSYSLGRLLEICGFVNIAKVGPSDSRILNFTSYNLDTESNNSIYKPDSFFIEALAPN